VELSKRFWRLAVWAIVLFAFSASLDAVRGGYQSTYTLQNCYAAQPPSMNACQDTQVALTWSNAAAVLLRVPAIALALLAVLVVVLPMAKRDEAPKTEWTEAA